MFGLEAIGGGLLSMGGKLVEGAFSAKAAQDQMDFQAHQAATSHQREVTDLRAAGLNPILSAGGKGAAAMSGAMSHMPDPLGPAVNSAREVAIAKEEVRLKKAQADRETSTSAVIKEVGQALMDGIEAIKSTAKSAGEAAAQISEFVRNFKMPGVPQAAELVRSLIPDSVNPAVILGDTAHNFNKRREVMRQEWEEAWPKAEREKSGRKRGIDPRKATGPSRPRYIPPGDDAN